MTRARTDPRPAAGPGGGAVGGRAARATRALRGGLADLLGLVVPVACGGCGREDVAWCPSCAALLAGVPRRCEREAPRLDLVDRTLVPVWAVAAYAGEVRSAVGAWKDGGRADLDRPLAAAMASAGRHVAGVLGPGPGPGPGPGVGAGHGPPRVVVVPVPSTAAARRRRGRAPVDALAAGVADGLRAGGRTAGVGRVLARRGGADLAGLGARDRVRAVAGRVRVRRPQVLAGAVVVLVDDVLTTGATLAACVRELRGSGADVVGCCVLAATPPPSRARAATATGTSVPDP